MPEFRSPKYRPSPMNHLYDNGFLPQLQDRLACADDAERCMGSRRARLFLLLQRLTKRGTRP